MLKVYLCINSMMVLQVRSSLVKKYSRVPLAVLDEDHEIGLKKTLLSSDLEEEDSDSNFPRV